MLDACKHLRRTVVALQTEIGRTRTCIASTRELLGTLDATWVSHPRATRVLVVDADHAAAEVVQRALRLYDLHVECADHRRAAAVLARYFIPDIALLELGTSETDAWGLARELRETTRIHLIAMTLDPNEVARQRSLDHGFVAHVQRPLDIHALVARLRALPHL